MKALTTTVGVLSLAASGALAGGLDRTGQSVDIIFEEGNYGEISLARTSPSITGTDVLGFDTGNVADDFTSISGGVKLDFSDKFSMAMIFEEPFGSDIAYPSTSALLGGTTAIANTTSTTFVARYKFNENWSVHGGLRNQTARGNITLDGLAYGGNPPGGVSTYGVTLNDSNAWGYLVGAAYERPEIALRVALTYNSAITHKMDTTETAFGGAFPFVVGTTSNLSETDVETPQSVNLEFQTGIAADTLVFGSIRWAEWSKFKIDPVNFVNATGGGLVDLEDSITYTLGVGRRFSDQWAGSVSFTYEQADDDDLVSPLAPTNGLFAISVGAEYQATENMSIGFGVRHNWLGNARPETGTPDTARAVMEDNTATSFGMKVGFTF